MDAQRAGQLVVESLPLSRSPMDITALTGHLVLAVHDPLRPHHRPSGGASVESCVHVLGRVPVRLPADAALHDHQLQRLQGQSRILAPPLLRSHRGGPPGSSTNTSIGRE
jgi:hypothetical protein